MNLNKVGIIIGHEYSIRVKKKSFLLTTFLTPLLFGLCFAIPFVIMLFGGEDAKTVKVIDRSGIVTPYLESNETVIYQTGELSESVEAIRTSLKDLDLYAVVEISELNDKGDVTVDAYSDEPLSMDVKNNLKNAVNSAVEDHKLGLYNINNLDEILANVRSDIRINAMTMKEGGEAKEDSVELYMALAYIMGFMIYMFVFLFGNMVMRGVIEEKTSRVVEVIVSSVKSVELMMGKIIGIALVALTQFFIWVALTVLIVMGVSTFATSKVMAKGADVAAMAQQAGIETQVGGQTVDMAAVLEAAGKEDSTMVKILSQVSDMNWFLIIGSFALYFLFGYLLYASMFAAVGAAVDNEADTGQLQLPVTLPLILGLFLMLHAFEHPSSQLSFWASIIPWTSPMVMLARVPFGTVPGWQLILSLGLLFITFVATAYLSARIYKIGILTYGKKSTFKDLINWMKRK